MSQPASDKLFNIIDALTRAKIYYSLSIIREKAVSVVAAVPGQRWEIDVHRDGDVEVEVFRSNGEILDESQLASMIQNFAGRPGGIIR